MNDYKLVIYLCDLKIEIQIDDNQRQPHCKKYPISQVERSGNKGTEKSGCQHTSNNPCGYFPAFIAHILVSIRRQYISVKQPPKNNG
jgi:hypothetical protein